MTGAGQQWLDGWVYTLFGADGLALFSAHPLPLLLVAGALALLGLGALLWLLRSLHRIRARLPVYGGLLLRREGRTALRRARQIRRGGRRLRGEVRRMVTDRTERRSLLRLLDAFTAHELHRLLAHLLRLLQRADERREQALRTALEQHTAHWAALPDGAEREEVQERVATTRADLARLAHVHAERERLLHGLAEAADAVHRLEDELHGLAQARERSLPAFHEHLGTAAEQIGYLRRAHEELALPE